MGIGEEVQIKEVDLPEGKWAYLPEEGRQGEDGDMPGGSEGDRQATKEDSQEVREVNNIESYKLRLGKKMLR